MRPLYITLVAGALSACGQGCQDDYCRMAILGILSSTPPIQAYQIQPFIPSPPPPNNYDAEINDLQSQIDHLKLAQ